MSEFKQKNKKVFCVDVPIHINETFNNIFKYDAILKKLNVLKNIECNITIKNVKLLYYKDDIFYITSSLYMLVIWEDVKQWKIIKRV